MVQFPGTNCERETARALTAVFGDGVEFVWHADELPIDRYGAVVLPGGFAYGDHLRAGAIARFSPVMPGIQRFAANGGLVLGICNGFQVLLEAGLLPGAMLRNASLAISLRMGALSRRAHRHAVHAGVPRRAGARLPIAHGEGNYVSPVEAEGVVLRYCDRDGNITPEANPMARRTPSRASPTAAGTSSA